MPFTVDYKSCTLALFRHEAVKKIKRYRSGSNVHHRRQGLLVHRHVDLLLRVESAVIALRRFGQLELVAAEPTGRVQRSAGMRGVEVEPSHQYQGPEDWP